MRNLFICLAVCLAALTAGCYFSEYAQEADLLDNIDELRTGCEVDVETLLAEYMQYEANKHHYGDGPTPTPDPVGDRELTTSILLEQVWEHGCLTGRRDVVGALPASYMSLRDHLGLLEARLEILRDAETPTSIATPTPDD